MINSCSNFNNTYKVHGMVIESEVLLNELVCINRGEVDKVDVIISYGITPKNIERAIIKEKFFQASKTEMYFYIAEVAHYYVANGNMIIIEPDRGVDERQINSYLLGGCLGMILTQRNIIGIHGGTVILDGKGIIIAGPPGAGKSTLITAFIKSGHSFLSDDVSALNIIEDGEILIHPSYPQQKLCKDAVERMQYNVNCLKLIDTAREKYAITVEDKFCNNEVALSAIYEINVNEESKEVEINRITGREKINIIFRNIYGIQISRYIGIESCFFKHCADLASKVSVYKITRPQKGISVSEQMSLIKKSLDEEKSRSMSKYK